MPRTYSRLTVRIPLEYNLYKTSLNASSSELPTKYSQTIVTDISAGGIQFESPTPLLVGAILRLKIFLPSLPVIECLVRILRVELIHEEQKSTEISADKYWVSCYYLDIESESKASLDNFINQHKL
ncbi:MAG: PilZ domain-containing protein [Planctomycetota bacterium]